MRRATLNGFWKNVSGIKPKQRNLWVLTGFPFGAKSKDSDWNLKAIDIIISIGIFLTIKGRLIWV
jgi:hypothetical protein